MANGSQYAQYTSSAGFFGGLLDSIFAQYPAYAAKPTRPNPASQVLIARNASFVSDPDNPGTATHPPGYALADMWYNPLDPVYETPIFEHVGLAQGKPLVIGGQPILRQTGVKTSPKFYYTKAEVQEDLQELQPPPGSFDTLFRSPDAATLQAGPCEKVQTQVAETARERINRLVMNQFLSPFRARRSGGNSYQAISEAQDNLFRFKDGMPGDFTPEIIPAVIQSHDSFRIRRRR